MQENAAVGAESTSASEDASSSRGLGFAVLSYLMWGTLPLYMKAVDFIPAVEVVAHRVLWSLPVAGVILLALGRTSDIKAALREPRTMLMAALTAAIISANWAIYVWAIAVDRTVEAALGYYINPLMTVLLGAALLGERLNRYQMVAVALAVLAVVILTVDAGGLPWVSLALAGTFAAYGYLRKTLPVGPSQGFFLEVMLLALPSLGYVIWLETSGQGHFFADGGANVTLMMLAGPVTAIPLILYGIGAKALRISTVGILQYISPTIIALMAVFIFGEPFGPVRVVAFALIWAGLALYTWSMFYGSGKAVKAGR